MFFTFIAVPEVIFVQNFWLRKLSEAVVNGDLFLRVLLVYSILLIHSLAFFDSGKMLYQIEFKITVEYEIEDKIAFTVLLVEAHVVFNSYFMQHIEYGHFAGVWKWTVPVAIVAVTEMAVLSVAGIVFDFQLIWQIGLVEVLHGQHILPVLFSQRWEESLELLLHVTTFEELFNLGISYHFLGVQIFILWVFFRFVRISLIVDILEPSLEQILDGFEEMVMKLLQSPILIDPDDSWKIEKAMSLFLNMDTDFGPFTVNAIIVVILFDLFYWRKFWFEFRRGFEHQYDTGLTRDFLHGR